MVLTTVTWRSIIDVARVLDTSLKIVTIKSFKTNNCHIVSKAAKNNSSRSNFPGRNFSREHFSGANFPGGNFPRGGGIFLGGGQFSRGLFFGFFFYWGHFSRHHRIDMLDVFLLTNFD